MASEASNLGFYICGALVLLVWALKIPALLRRRHDPLLRAACLLLFAAGWLMFLAAPASITGLNRLTGIANIAAPAVYVLTTAFSGASLVLIINWRPAPPNRTRQYSRRCVAAYSLTVFAIIVLFWAGDAPVEQPTSFDVYYATSPYLREMIVLYLGAQAVAMMAASTLCWRWSREVGGTLRAGLRILAPAYLIIVSYDLIRLIAVAARWTGHNLDYLVDKVSVHLAAPACLLGALGFAVPLLGPRLARNASSVRQFRQLTPLWRIVRDVPTPGAVRASLPWWRTPPAILLTGRKTAIYDAILALTPYCDPIVRETAYHAALRHGEEESQAAAAADAAVIAVAAATVLDGGSPTAQTPHLPHPPTRPGQDLVPLSQALTSPVVQRLRQHPYAFAESSHP